MLLISHMLYSYLGIFISDPKIPLLRPRTNAVLDWPSQFSFGNYPTLHYIEFVEDLEEYLFAGS